MLHINWLKLINEFDIVNTFLSLSDYRQYKYLICLTKVNEIQIKIKFVLFLNQYFSIFQRKIMKIMDEKILFVLLIPIVMLNGCSKSKEQKLDEAEHLFSLARISETNNELTKAISLYKDAINLFRDSKSDSSVGKVFLSLARCQRSIGEYDSAITSYRQASYVFNKLGEKKSVRRVELELADFYNSLGETSEAILIGENSVATAKVLSDTADVFDALLCNAESHHHAGNYDKEIQILQELIELDSVFYKSQHKYDLIAKQITAYELNQQHPRAVELFEKFKIQSENSNDPEKVVRVFSIWGNLNQRAGRYRDAFSAYATALSKMDKQFDKYLQADILVSLGCLAYRDVHYDDARRYFNDALAIIKGLDNPVYEKLLILIRVAAEWKLDQSKVSIKDSDKMKICSDVQTIFHQIGYNLGEAFAIFLQARMLEENDTSQEIFRLYNKALEKFEEQAILKDDQNIKMDIINTLLDCERLNWYKPVLQYHCKRNDLNEVLIVNERLLSRRVIRFYTRLKIQTRDNFLNDLIQKLQWKQSVIRLVQEQIEDEISKGHKASYERIRLLQEKYLSFQEDVYSINDELKMSKTNYRYLLSPAEITLNEIKDSLLSNEALVEFILLPNHLFVLTVSNDTARLFTREIQDQRLRVQIEEYNRLLSDSKMRGANERANELSSVIGEMLLTPIEQIISSYDKLFIVTENDFDFLPVHTLKVHGNFLFEKKEICYLPTAKCLLFKKIDDGEIKNIVGFGHPGETDWDVEYELMDLRSFYDSAKILVNESALLQSLKKVNYDVLHVSAQFHLDEIVPNNSTIILSDGKLNSGYRKISVGNLLDLVPPRILIFANVSNTNGDLMSLVPLGFLANGTPTVIVNMWQGERRARRYFDEMFYTNLKTGMSVDYAYRDAIIAMSRNAEYSDIHSCGMFYRFGK